MNELTPSQIEALEDMIARRMANTGETRAEACTHISLYLQGRLNPKKHFHERLSSEDYDFYGDREAGMK